MIPGPAVDFLLSYILHMYIYFNDLVGDVISFCAANKNTVAADSLNAAHFINCSDPSPALTHFIQECPYPQLFSMETNTCQDFRTIPTDSRIVPQAPCKFTVNVDMKHNMELISLKKEREILWGKSLMDIFRIFIHMVMLYR